VGTFVYITEKMSLHERENDSDEVRLTKPMAEEGKRWEYIYRQRTPRILKLEVRFHDIGRKQRTSYTLFV
jgi:hypothetical protein